MKLDEYLTKLGISNRGFATMIQSTPEAVRLWRIGSRIPNLENMGEILRVTGGAVEANDFYHGPPA